MVLITSRKEGDVPAVPNPSEDQPVTLEVVEVRPGVFLKLHARDKAAWLATQPAEQIALEKQAAKADEPKREKYRR